MKIINDGIRRGAVDCDDMFLKFISKDGMGLSEYPTIIFLANRLFLKSEDRIGAHVEITETIKLKDDFSWYKTKGQTAIKNTLMETLPNKDAYKGIPFFKEDTETSHNGIVNCWYSGKTHYMHIGTSLKASTSNPFDTSSKTVLFPQDTSSNNFTDTANNIVDICSLNPSSDLILTKTRLYRYNYETNTMVQRLKLSNGEHDATAMCRTASYFIITCNKGGGFLIITNIDSSDTTSLNYKKPAYANISITEGETSTSVGNGLNPSNNYTFCFPVGGDTIEINGGSEKTCLFNCASWMSSSSSYIAPEGTKEECTTSCHYNNEVVLFSAKFAYDTMNNIYPMENGVSYFKLDKYMLLFGKEESTQKPTLSIFTNISGQEKRPITLCEENIIPSTAVAGYMQDKDTIFVFTSSGTTYKSFGKDDNSDSAFFPIAFDYSKERTTKKADVNKMPLGLNNLIGLVNGEDVSWTKVNNRDSTFLFIRFGLDSGNARWFAFGDDDRRDTAFRDMTSAFDVG
jgi:hypothetical protein